MTRLVLDNQPIAPRKLNLIEEEFYQEDPPYDRVLRYEGGINRREVGGGGISNKGITKDIYDSYLRRKNLPNQSVEQITVDEAKDIYKNEFFQIPKIHTLPKKTGELLFDYGVMSNPKRAIKTLQEVVGTKSDGMIGNKTRRKTGEYINQHGENKLLDNILKNREAHHAKLIKDNPDKYKEFERGWQNRIDDLRESFDISSLNPFKVSEAYAGQGPRLVLDEPTGPRLVLDEPGKSVAQEGREMATEAGKASLRGFEGLFAGLGAATYWMGENIAEGIPSDVAKALTPGVQLLPKGSPEWQKNIQEKVGNKIAKWGKNAYSFWREESQRGIEAPDIETFKGSFIQNPSWTRAVAVVAEAIPSLAGATVIGIATGNPLAGAATLGLIEGSGQYVEARQAGKDVVPANVMGGLSVVGTTILEVLPLTRFVKGGGGKLGKDMFLGAIQEGGEEVLQALWQNLIARIGYDKTRNLTEGMIEGFIGGAGSGGVLGGLTSGRGIKTDGLIRDALDKGVSPQDINAMQEAVKNQIVNNADEIESKLEKSAIDESGKYEEWLKSQVAHRPELDVPLHPAPKTSVDKGVEQRLFDTPVEKPVAKPTVPKKKQTLISAIKERGGLGTEQIKKDYKWNEDIKQSKIPIGVFKKGASELDDMADQLQNQGLLKVPEDMNPGDYLMQQLKDEQLRNADLFAQDLESQYDTEYEQYLKEQEEAGYGQDEIKQAERELEADLEEEVKGEVDTEEIPDWVTEDFGVEPGSQEEKDYEARRDVAYRKELEIKKEYNKTHANPTEEGFQQWAETNYPDLYEPKPFEQTKEGKEKNKKYLDTLKKQEKPEHPLLAELRKTTLPEYNTNKSIVEADAFVDEIRELNPKKEDDQVWIKHGSKYEVTVSYPHSLGEMGNATTFNYDEKPTVEDIKRDIIEEYQRFKKEVNEETVRGVVAKSGRDENIEKKIDDVIAKKKKPDTSIQEGKIDSERLYLLKQDAELYPKVEQFIESMDRSDLTKSQLTDIWNKAQEKKTEPTQDKRKMQLELVAEARQAVQDFKDGKDITDRQRKLIEGLSKPDKLVSPGTAEAETMKRKLGISDKKLPEHLQKIADKEKGIEDVTPKGFGPGGTAGSSAAAKVTGYGGIIESSEKSTKEKVAKTDYAKVNEEIPSREETNIIKEALKIVAPARVSPITKKGALILRKNIATLAHNDAMAQEATQKAHRAFQWMNKEDSHKFIDDVESGRSTKSALQPFADMLRGLLDGRRKNIQDLGKGQLEGYYENYFPHIWKDPKKAKNIISQIMGRKRLEGTKSFLKKRIIVSVKDGLERGLELVSDNPVDLVLLKIHEMDRYIMAQNIIRDSKEQGLAKFVYSRGKSPEGYARVNDNAFTVFMPPEMTKKEAFDSILVEQLTDIAKTLGIDTKRFVSIGGKRWGYAQDIGKGKVRTRWAGPESVLAHEIGHVLGYQYDVYNTIGRRKEGETKVHLKGKKAGEQYFKPAKEAIEYRRDIDKQWRDLADARFKGSKTSNSYKNYVRNSKEKEAVLVEALIHAPKEFQSVAPDLYKYFVKFINSHAELRPLLDIEPSLVLGEADAKIKIPGFTTLGHYYMPEDLARLINNHLSPGLRNADNKLVSGSYNVLRGMGNILNQVNLSLSAFHALNVTTDIWASTTGLAIKKFFTRGQRVQGMIDVLKVPIAPILSVWEGTRIKKAYRQQMDSIKSPKVKEMVRTVVEAGGRDRMDVYYYNAQIKALEQTFRDVLKGSGVEKMKGVAKIPFNVFGATLETLAKPLMQWYVPTGKLGLFSKLAQYEMERAESGEITDEQLKGQLASVWDSVDNRMGQLIYDNLFWNKTLKDTLMLAIRSVGWNLGSWREYGGGAVDVVNTAERLRSGDKLLSHKMSYVLGASIIYSILGAVIQYVLTGKPPEEPKDYFFPKTGRIKSDGSPERLSLPTYAKDVYAYSQRPLQTVRNKAHPLIGLLNEQLQNKDFFNVEVSDFKDPLVDQIYDRAKHIVNYSKPFSFKNYEKMEKTGEGKKVTAFVSITGITSAPSYVTRSAAQKLMYRYMIDRIPNVSKTKEDFEKSAYRKQFKSRIRKGEPVDYKEAAQYLGVKSFKRTIKEAQLPPFAESYKRLSLKEALNVFAIATRKEKQETKNILISKFRRAYKDNKVTPYMMSMFRELLQK